MRKINLSVINIILIMILFSYYVVLPSYVEADIYHPVKKYPVPPANVENLYIKTRDNVILNAWYVKAKANLPTIVFCHGNGGNLDYYRQVLKILKSRGFGIFMFDYRGYGKSTGYPYEKGLYTDLWSVIHYLQNEKRISKDNMILWGQSLGGAVVIDIASKTRLKGVIVQASFTSIKDMAVYRAQEKFLDAYNSMEKGLIISFVNNLPFPQNFNSEDKIRNVKCPVLIAHSLNDRVVPAFMSAELAKLNPRSRLFISKYGRHNDYIWIKDRSFKFIKTLN